MAKLVTALACTHNPTIYWNNLVPEQNLNDAFNPIRKRLKEAEVDALVVLANDHISNFFLDNMPSFAVGIAPEAGGPFIGELEAGMPEWKGKINQDLARGILKEGIRSGVDFASTQKFTLDHAFLVPLMLSLSKMKIPIVPIFSNALVEPVPRTRRFYKVGQILKRIIDSRPKDERIAVLASFNYSIEVGGHKMGSYDLDFDKRAEEYLREGNVKKILNEFSIERIFQAGNSSGEYLNYVSLLGMLGTRKPDYYRDFMPKGADVHTKCPLAAWDLE